jgi:hypothetical protein
MGCSISCFIHWFAIEGANEMMERNELLGDELEPVFLSGEVNRICSAHGTVDAYVCEYRN